MIDLNAMNEWQHRDEMTGLVFPWYTKSFLDELVTWDLKDKVVFEYGCGASSLYFAVKGAKIYGCDVDADYLEAINIALINRRIKGGLFYQVEKKELYVDFISSRGIKYDIIIIDGEPIAWRDDCVKPAIDCLKPGGKLIIDNWDQKSVGWLPSEETQAIVTALPHTIYSQAGHPDWKTLVANKP